ncbi:hypothetical protein C8F01DRAFT_1088871 [Mycena amicta]|nr:hypothetical protein C8F01DRAFT_1088871 [Mycena amicta]
MASQNIRDVQILEGATVDWLHPVRIYALCPLWTFIPHNLAGAYLNAQGISGLSTLKWCQGTEVVNLLRPVYNIVHEAFLHPTQIPTDIDNSLIATAQRVINLVAGMDLKGHIDMLFEWTGVVRTTDLSRTTDRRDVYRASPWEKIAAATGFTYSVERTVDPADLHLQSGQELPKPASRCLSVAELTDQSGCASEPANMGTVHPDEGYMEGLPENENAVLDVDLEKIYDSYIHDEFSA